MAMADHGREGNVARAHLASAFCRFWMALLELFFALIGIVCALLGFAQAQSKRGGLGNIGEGSVGMTVGLGVAGLEPPLPIVHGLEHSHMEQIGQPFAGDDRPPKITLPVPHQCPVDHGCP